MKTLFDAVIRGSIWHRHLVVVFACALAALGVWSSWTASLDALPDFAPPLVIVQSEAPGLGTTAVESRVTLPLEQALLGIPGATQVRSTSSPGLAVVRVTFEDDVDIFRARQFVTERLADARAALPAGFPAPRLGPITAPVGVLVKLAYTTASDEIQPVWEFAEWKLRPKLTAIEGIARVTVHGGSAARIEVRPDVASMLAHGVTFEDLRLALASAQSSVGLGWEERGAQQQPLRADALFVWGNVDAIAATVVVFKNQVPIRVADIARVERASAPPVGTALYDGRPAISVTVEKLPWADTLRLSREIDIALGELDGQLPPGARRERATFRQADFIRTSLTSLAHAMMLGSVLVVIILVAFLRSPRIAGITVIALPLSILAAVAVLRLRGVTINGMILGGLAIAVGEVVDDAIVDVENIWRRMRENRASASPKNVLEVVHDASVEVRGSVVYASLIIVAVLAPIMLLGGLTGKIFAPLAESYAIAIGASLFVAVTITPAASALLLPALSERGSHETRMSRLLRSAYERALAVVRRRPGSIALSSFLLGVVGLVVLPFLGGEFLPELQEGVLIAQVDTAPGTSLHDSTYLASRAGEALRQGAGIPHVAARIGRATNDEDAAPAHHAEMDIVLPEGADPEEIQERISEHMGRIPGIRFGVESFLGERINELLSGERAPIAVKVYGKDLASVRAAARNVMEHMESMKELEFVRSPSLIDVPTVDLRIDDARLDAVGLRRADAIAAAAVARQGLDVTSAFVPEGFSVPVVLARASDGPAADWPIFANGGGVIPLSSVTDVKLSTEPPAVDHEGGLRVASVTARVEGAALSTVAQDLERWLASAKHPAGTTWEVSGQASERRHAGRRLVLTVIAILLVVFIFLWLAFDSLMDAFVVLAGLPLGLVGGVLSALALPEGMSMASLVGFVALAGIICRNGIMLVTHKNQLVAERAHDSKEEVIFDAARDRLLPIMMTAATAFLGLVPLAASLGSAGSEFEAPMAVIVCGGLLSSTALNLIAVPAFYVWRIRRSQAVSS